MVLVSVDQCYICQTATRTISIPILNCKLVDDELRCHSRLGSARLEKACGDRFVDFVRDFRYSHGQGITHTHTHIVFRATGEVFAAPVGEIAAAARAAGFTAADDGIYNLLAVARANASTATSRL